MILKKLHLYDYKILKKIDIEFTKPISVFIGINGSGKSSVLESLALIFSVAYEQIILKKKTEAPHNIRNSFVEYLLRFETETEKETMQSEFSIDYIPIKLFINNDGKAEIEINLKKKQKHFISIIEKKYSEEDLLPKRIIIYYSGISNHFQTIYHSTEDYLLKQLTQNPLTTKHGYVENAKMPMFLFNPTDFNILLAGLWSFGFSERINKKLFDILKIQSSVDDLIVIKISKIEFDKNDLKSKIKDLENTLMLIEDNDPFSDLEPIKQTLLKNLNQNRIDNFFGASGKLGTFLKQLKEMCLSPNDVYDNIEQEYIFKFSVHKWQTLSEEILQNPKLVFELLLMLKHNGLLKEICVNIIKQKVKINAEQLSEGEKQVIIITALNEILGTNNSLFLFDEPDNFLHPSLQDDLIINIEENNDTNEIYQNHYLITTHNPSFLNNLNPDQGELFLMNLGKLVHHDLSWFGRDINDTVHDIMGSEFRPKWAINEIQEVDKLLDLENIEKGEIAFNALKKKLSGTDIDIIRLQSKLDFIKD